MRARAGKVRMALGAQAIAADWAVTFLKHTEHGAAYQGMQLAERRGYRLAAQRLADERATLLARHRQAMRALDRDAKVPWYMDEDPEAT